jgi:hypothetical protein
MTLQQIDDSLAAWSNRLATVADNLLWLQGESAYKMFTGGGGQKHPRPTGLTAQRVEPVLAALSVTFEHFNLLHAVIDQATHLRKTMPAFLGTAQRLAEIEHLLCGRSVDLPPIDLPLEQRTLLTGFRSAQAVTPSELLEPMARTFATARDLVLTVDGAWQQLAQGITRAEAGIARLQASPGTATSLVLAEACHRLSNLRESLQTDPLGALAELNERVQPLLADLMQTLAAEERLRHQLEEARAHCEHALEMQRQAQAMVARARGAVVDCSAVEALSDPGAEARLRRLCEWLEQLQHRFDEGSFEVVAAGLRHWNTAAAECVSHAQRLQEAAQAAAGARRELRGRLDALKAKARVRGVAEGRELAGLAGRAEALLAVQPTDVQRTAELVAAYARALNGVKVEA